MASSIPQISAASPVTPTSSIEGTTGQVIRRLRPLVRSIVRPALRRSAPLVLALGAVLGIPSGLVQAGSYSPAFHGDSGVDCWLSNTSYGISINPITMYAVNATSGEDWQRVGWIPALYVAGANGTWNLVTWGTWTVYSTSDYPVLNRPEYGGAGQSFDISHQGNYRIAIWYRWLAQPLTHLSQQDRFEWLTGPYAANGGPALYPYCAFTQGTAVIGGR